MSGKLLKYYTINDLYNQAIFTYGNRGLLLPDTATLPDLAMLIGMTCAKPSQTNAPPELCWHGWMSLA